MLGYSRANRPDHISLAMFHLSLFQASRVLRQLSKKHKQLQAVGTGRGAH